MIAASHRSNSAVATAPRLREQFEHEKHADLTPTTVVIDGGIMQGSVGL